MPTPIFAFDSASGRLLWKSDRIADDIKLSHLLGVAKGRLVATGNRVVLFDVKTGKLLHAWPDSGKALDGYGRGLLAGDKIYWPTQNEIQILDQRTGLRAEPPIKLLETYHAKGGNLVAGDGYLIVAQAGRAGGLLPEQPPDRALPATDRAGARGCRQLLPAGPGRRGHRQRSSSRSRCTRTRSKRHARTRSSTGFPWPAPRAIRNSACSFAWARSARKAGKWDEAADRLKSAGEVTRSANEQLEAQLFAGGRLSRRVEAAATRSPSASGSCPTIGCAACRSPPPTAIAPCGPIS